ncbi:hypothetical protein PIB30_047916 [Stylosanthes scabra]|uniref:Uncharacterized protein n=1 Tax=Stylosanthes scabra TaxID=79078 RepID=A0ABU6TGP4_9FABA|nr:hypothetical protein [Stylosanthes scabra]
MCRGSASFVSGVEGTSSNFRSGVGESDSDELRFWSGKERRPSVLEWEKRRRAMGEHDNSCLMGDAITVDGTMADGARMTAQVWRQRRHEGQSESENGLSWDGDEDFPLGSPPVPRGNFAPHPRPHGENFPPTGPIRGVPRGDPRRVGNIDRPKMILK